MTESADDLSLAEALRQVDAAAGGDAPVPAAAVAYVTALENLAAAARRDLARPAQVIQRPADADHAQQPDLGDALVMAGVLCHYVGGSAELRTRLARWLEHHQGDLDEQIVLWYLSACHALLEPACRLPMDWDAHPGRTR